MAVTTRSPLDPGDIAKTLIAALDDDALDELARRVANRQARPEMLDVKRAARLQNDMAARIILARPGRRNSLLIDWARRYTVRRAQERREFGLLQ